MQLNLAAIVALFGAVATLLTSILKESSWSAQVKSWIALGVSVAMGIAATYAGGVTDPGNIGLVVTAVIGASQLYYSRITGPLGLDKAIASAIPSPFRLIAAIFTKRAAKEEPITRADLTAASEAAADMAVNRVLDLLKPAAPAPPSNLSITPLTQQAINAPTTVEGGGV